MCVEYFTPSKEDIEQAPARLLFYKIWGAYLSKDDLLPDSAEMTIIDFSHLYTEEEKAAARRQLADNFHPFPFGSVEFTSHEPYDVARIKAMAKHVLECSPLRKLDDVSITEVGTAYASKSGSLKDFTPVPVRSVLPDAQIKPSYRVTAVKIIDGRKITFYAQELPKDKS